MTTNTVTKATLNKSLARRASRLRAVCFVANPRHSCGYGCGLRLASHPAAGRAPSRELIQRCPKRQNRGFTLIELMIVVAIVAIVAAIAYPSYQSYIQRTRRANAAACLQEMAQQMERRYTTSMSYNTPNTLPTLACATELNGVYSFAFASGQPTASSFTIVATPVGAQAADTRCGALALNHRGEKFVQESDQTAALVSACWR